METITEETFIGYKSTEGVVANVNYGLVTLFYKGSTLAQQHSDGTYKCDSDVAAMIESE